MPAIDGIDPAAIEPDRRPSFFEVGVHAELGAIAGALDMLGRQQRSIRDELAGQAAQIQATAALLAQPVSIRNVAAGLVPAAGALELDLGGPALGRRWAVMAATVAGDTFADAVGGSALLIVSGIPPHDEAFTSAYVVDRAPCLPATAFYARGQIPVQPFERVYVLVTGGTVGAGYIAAVTIEQYQTGERVQVAPT